MRPRFPLPSPLPSPLRLALLPPPVERFARSLCAAGLILGTLLFAVSLTPSLVPRSFGLQGILSGLALGAGYGLGVFGRWLWGWLELPAVRGRWRELAKIALGLFCVGVALAFLWQASAWQNSVHELFSLPPVQTSRPFTVGLIAAAVFAALLGLARAFGALTRWMARHLGRVVPWRLSVLVALSLSLTLAWTLANGVLARGVFNAFDTSWARLDAYIEDEVAQPGASHLTGSPASLVAWRDLGRQGRRFVTGAAAPQDIAAVTGQPALAPLRVYVGLNSGESIAQRAALALAELQRVGGFEREVLVVVTPTGTGWVDPAAMNSVEHLHHGNVASVAVQYSYLPSWLTLMAQPEHGTETARTLFRAVYEHWRTLPPDRRPRLVLHGLSLGALNSERSADVWDLISDPPQGALWSGPPFRSTLWQWVTANRNPDSPAWQPRFRDGSVIRFTAQDNALADFDAPWGPLRVVYLQYATDPVTFFHPLVFAREPAWLAGPRGPDVSPSLRWFPVVTFLQLAVDIAAAENAPIGHGHAYATEHYIDAWLAVSAPEGWTDERIAALKAAIGDLGPRKLR